MYRIRRLNLSKQYMDLKIHNRIFNWLEELYFDHYSKGEIFYDKKKLKRKRQNAIRAFTPFISLSSANIRDLAFSKDSELSTILNFRLKGFEFLSTIDFPHWILAFFTDNPFDSFYFHRVLYPGDIWKRIAHFKAIEDARKPRSFSKTESTDVVVDSDSLLISEEVITMRSGIWFMSISKAQKFCPNLIEEHYGTVINADDNYSATVNAAVFSDGSFVYLSQNKKTPFELTTYFRLDNQHLSQFERTLIIGEEDSSIEYWEGCNSVPDNTSKYHAAAVELKTFKNARIIYSTIQDWFVSSLSEGGVYNLVTKRGMCLEENSKIYWNQAELGAAITVKYPSCILLGKNSYGDFYSLTFTDHYQQTDTGSKMIHIGEGSRSQIVSKGVQLRTSQTCVHVLINHKAKNCVTDSQCDTLLLTNRGVSFTFPVFKSENKSQIDHEASLLPITEDELFYLSQRGIPMLQFFILITEGFYAPIFRRLPLALSGELRAYVYHTLFYRDITN